MYNNITVYKYRYRNISHHGLKIQDNLTRFEPIVSDNCRTDPKSNENIPSIADFLRLSFQIYKVNHYKFETKSKPRIARNKGFLSNYEGSE